MFLVFSSISFAFNVIPHVGRYLACDGDFFFYLHFHCVNCSCLDFVKEVVILNFHLDVLLSIVYSNWICCSKELQNFILVCSSLLNG